MESRVMMFCCTDMALNLDVVDLSEMLFDPSRLPTLCLCDLPLILELGLGSAKWSVY